MKARASLGFALLAFGCQSQPAEVVETRPPEASGAKMGLRKVDLDRLGAHHLVARRTPDGQLDISCVKGQAAAEAAIRAAEHSGR